MSESSSSSGVGFCGLLTVAFIVLKLTDTIDWSWWYVLMPMWLPIVLLLFLVGCVYIYALAVDL